MRRSWIFGAVAALLVAVIISGFFYLENTWVPATGPALTWNCVAPATMKLQFWEHPIIGGMRYEATAQTNSGSLIKVRWLDGEIGLTDYGTFNGAVGYSAVLVPTTVLSQRSRTTQEAVTVRCEADSG